MIARIKSNIWDLWVRSYSNLLHTANFVGKLQNKHIRRILIYHDINYQHLGDFRRQVHYYVKNYTVVSLSSFLDIVRDKRNSQDNILCITFDDAYKGVYKNASGVLDEYNIKPCIFIPPGFINASDKAGFVKNNIKSDIGGDSMTWEELKSLANRGYEIGSHSYSHTDFGGDRIDYKFELEESKLEIENRLGCKVKYFAFPFGKKVNIAEKAVDKVKKNGYIKAFSGISSNVINNEFLLPRTYINLKWKQRTLGCVLLGFFDNQKDVFAI